jgi:hypothetical protein
MSEMLAGWAAGFRRDISISVKHVRAANLTALSVQTLIFNMIMRLLFFHFQALEESAASRRFPSREIT